MHDLIPDLYPDGPSLESIAFESAHESETEPAPEQLHDDLHPREPEPEPDVRVVMRELDLGSDMQHPEASGSNDPRPVGPQHHQPGDLLFAGPLAAIPQPRPRAPRPLGPPRDRGVSRPLPQRRKFRPMQDVNMVTMPAQRFRDTHTAQHITSASNELFVRLLCPSSLCNKHML